MEGQGDAKHLLQVRSACYNGKLMQSVLIRLTELQSEPAHGVGVQLTKVCVKCIEHLFYVALTDVC